MSAATGRGSWFHRELVGRKGIFPARDVRIQRSWLYSGGGDVQAMAAYMRQIRREKGVGRPALQVVQGPGGLRTAGHVNEMYARWAHAKLLREERA